MLITEQGQIIRMKTGDIRPIGRDTQGVRLIDLEEGDKSCRSRRCRAEDGTEPEAEPGNQRSRLSPPE